MRWTPPTWVNPRHSLRARFALLLGGSGLAFALLAALLVDAYERDQLIENQGQAMRREAQLISRSLDVALQDRLRQLRDTAAQPLLSSGLMEPGDTRLLLEGLRAQQPALAWVAVTNARGRVQVASNALQEGQNMSQERWFIEGMRRPWVGTRRPAGALAPHLGLEGNNAPALIDLAVPLTDPQGRPLGVLVARLRWDWLDALHQSLQDPAHALPGSETLVLDRDGHVLLGPAAWLDQAPLREDLPQLRGGAAPRVLRWGVQGDYVTAWGRYEGSDASDEAALSVLVRQPAELAFRSADVLRQRLLGFGVLATLVYMAISVWLAGRVVRPIRALSDAATRMGSGSTPGFHALAESRDDEVATLARTLQTLHLELAHRMAQLAQTSRMAHVGGWYIDLVSKEASWTEEMARIYERPGTAVPTPEEALSYFPEPHRQRLRDALRQLVRNHQPYDLELPLHTPNGKRKWVRAQAQPVWDGQRVLRLEGVTQDITERRAAEEAVRELNAKLEQRVAERTAELQSANSELDSFAYAVSHDLRAPLRAMSGFSQALLEDHAPALDANARGYIEQIVKGSERMGGLIEGLLVLSRSVRGELRADEVDLSALAERCVAELRRNEPQRQVDVRIAPGLHVIGDRRMLDAALNNLIGNAWKYSAKRDDAQIVFEARPIDGERWFCLTDNGAGFDMAHAGRLFKAFARLHRQDEFPGLGIGLATVQRIIQRHGGRIAAQAATEQGACFRFTLPPRRAAHMKESVAE